MRLGRFIKSDNIIASAFWQLLIVMTLADLMYALSSLADDIIMSRFIGEYGIASYGLSIPFQYLVAMLGTFFAAGTQVVCSGLIGKGMQREANRTFTVASLMLLVSSIVIGLIFALGAEPIALLLGAGRDPEHLLENTRNYLIGMSVGLPFSFGTTFLIPIAALNGKKAHVAAATNVMMITNVAGDLANVFIFHGGMLGMGLAVSISFVFASFILVLSFRKGEGLRLDFSELSIAGFKDVAFSGLLASLTRMSTIVSSYTLNNIILVFAGTTVLAAYSMVMGGVTQFIGCLATATGRVTLVMVSFFFSEADLDGLRKLFRAALSVALGPSLLITVVLFIFAEPLMSIFTTDPELLSVAATGLRIYVIGILFFTMRQFYISFFQASHSTKMAAFSSIAGELVLPVACAFVGIRLFGLTGLWVAFPLAEALYLVAVVVLSTIKYKHFPRSVEELLFLDEDFDVPPENALAITVHNLDEVGVVHEQVLDFCDTRGFSKFESNRLAFASEELMNDIYSYGVGAGESHSLTYNLKLKDDSIIMYTRDDFPTFDVTAERELPEGDLLTGIGVRSLFALSSNVVYNSAFSLNNIMAKIPREALSQRS